MYYGASALSHTVSRVVTPAASYLLTDLATVKAELDLADADAPRDARLERYIREASKAAQNYCNRSFAEETIEDRFYPQKDAPLRILIGGEDPLRLTRWPIVSIGGVSEYSSASNYAALVSGVDYLEDDEKGQLTRLDSNLFPQRWPVRPIVVTYSAGYATIPDDVSAAVIRMVVQRYFANIRDPLIKSEQVEGIGRTDYIIPAGGEGNMTADVSDLLDNYRVPVIA